MMDYQADLSLSSLQFRSLMDFSEQVQKAHSFEDLIARSNRYFGALGATALNCGMFESETSAMIGMSSNMKADWLEQYVAEDMAASDPIAAHFGRKDHAAAIGWGDPDRMPDRPDERGVYFAASAAGYRNMLLVPVKPEGQAFTTAVAFFNDMADPEARRYAVENGGLIMLAGSMMGLRAVQLFSRGAEGRNWLALQRSPLSPRELEVLKWLARGLRTDQIAYQLDLRPVTIHMHLRSARKKLGARTREQMMAQAALRGFL